jgi:glutamyl-tRNA reductase
MVGVSWRQGGTESLAEFTLREEDTGERLTTFARELELGEVAYLGTCNRVELIFARTERTPGRDLRRQIFALLTGREPAPGEAERRLRAWQGEGAAEHLFLIAAGLDSACVGETEIVGQVRAAYERAASLGLAGAALEIVFDEALKIAGRVRGETRLAEGRVSLAEIAVDSIRERIAATPGTVALIGVSPMTERAALALAPSRSPLVVVNRSAAKAEALAARFSIEHASLDAFLAAPPPVEAVLSATGAPGALLTEPVLARLTAAAPSGRPPLIVDMAIPADADPEACERLGIPRVGMDEIVRRAEANRAARLMYAAEAREHVDRALHGLKDRFAERFYGPLFGTLQQRYQMTAEEGVKRLLKKELKGLGTEERAAIEVWSKALARRFAHIPCLGLRGLLYGGPEGSVEAFLSGLDPEFADELRAALERGSASRRRAGTPSPEAPGTPSRDEPGTPRPEEPGTPSPDEPADLPARSAGGAER